MESSRSPVENADMAFSAVVRVNRFRLSSTFDQTFERSRDPTADKLVSISILRAAALPSTCGSHAADAWRPLPGASVAAVTEVFCDSRTARSPREP